MNTKLIIGIIILLIMVGCKVDSPSKDKIDRDTSKNTVIYETFDDGNCGDDWICPPPEEFDNNKK